MRLIDADAFLADESEAYMKAQIALAEQNADRTIDTNRYINLLVHKKIQMLIADAPTIGPKRGEWITVWDECGENENGYECSVCGAEVDERFPNCPYCRAKMKGADDE